MECSLGLLRICNGGEISKIKDEVFLWAVTASVLSGFCKDDQEASSLYGQHILKTFNDMPEKQHCFKITLNKTEQVGKVWLMERGISDLRVSFIGLDKEHQKRGYAAEVFRMIEKYALKIDFNTLSLNVFSHLPHAKRLYEKIGFVVKNETKKGEKIVATEMEKKLIGFED